MPNLIYAIRIFIEIIILYDKYGVLYIYTVNFFFINLDWKYVKKNHQFLVIIMHLHLKLFLKS